MLSIYAKLSSHVLIIQVAVNLQGTVFTLARLKIVSTIKNLIFRHGAIENDMFLRDSQLV